MSNLFIPGQTIGIVGGGHLARLLALSAKSIGFQVGIFDPKEGCSAAEVADWQIVSTFDDELALVKMAEKCDILTFEYSLVAIEVIRKLDELVTIVQSDELLACPQDRLLERRVLEESNINIAPYGIISQISDIEGYIDSIGFPCILKSVHKREGQETQHLMTKVSDIRGCLPLIKEGKCILEALIPFEKEIAVMVVGNGNGDYTTFPVAETFYDEDKQFVSAVVPADISTEIVEEVYRIADNLAVTLNLQGVMTLEMFITSSGMIYVNTINPGPHDAGSYSMEATNLSQFDAHVRGICGWQLPEVKLQSAAVLLQVQESQLVETISYIPFKKNWYHHYYGNDSLNQKEVVGHITALTTDIEGELTSIRETQIWHDKF